jgi:hypothetical protein
MAIQMELNLSNGINLPSAYMVVSNMKFSYSDTNEVVIRLSIYKDYDSFSAGKEEIIGFVHTCSGEDFEYYFSSDVLNLENKNHLDNAYTWLLNLYDYSTAIKV